MDLPAELRTAKEADLDRVSPIVGHAFGLTIDDVKPWLARAGVENVRVLERGSTVIGGLLEIPMGQYFGGRSVSTLGVAGVAVAPHERGRGVAAGMMVSMLRQARARGFALSTLYPATVSLYRRAGYERAGACFTISFDPRTLEVERVRDVTIGEVEGTPEEVMAIYRATAPRHAGYLDRGPYLWSRVSQPRKMTTKTFTVAHGGEVEGYVVVAHVMAGEPSTVTVTDLAAKTPRAARAILRLLVEYRSLAATVKWKGGPSDVFTNLLPERHVTISMPDYFMVRVVDVERALVQRGWPRSARGTVILEVADASLPENAGRWAVSLEDGRARVVVLSSDGGAPRATISERGLAALYTGHASAHVLVQAGWLEADEETCVLLDEWFAGPYPTTRDFF